MRYRRLFALIGIATVLACGGGGGGGEQEVMVFTMAGAAAPGTADGAPGVSRFNNPVNCAVANDGAIYVSDFDNGRVRKIGLNAVTSTVVNQANFSRPFGIAFAGGELYVQTDANDTGGIDNTTGTIWKVDLTTGAATVVVRNIGRPRGMVGLPDGRLVLSNLSRNIIQILNPDTATLTTLAGADGVAGFANGTGAAARFNRPYGLCRRIDNAVLVADQANNRIRLVTLTGEVTTFSGQGAAGYVNGTRATARYNNPQDVDIDAFGVVYVSDNGNHRFRVINGDSVGLLAGDGIAGFKDGTLLESQFYGMEGSAISEDDLYIYVCDGTKGDGTRPFNRIRKLCIRELY